MIQGGVAAAGGGEGEILGRMTLVRDQGVGWIEPLYLVLSAVGAGPTGTIRSGRLRAGPVLALSAAVGDDDANLFVGDIAAEVIE